MVARQTLTLFVWVRILVRLPPKTTEKSQWSFLFHQNLTFPVTKFDHFTAGNLGVEWI